jgi:hypothetical protein
MAHNLFRTSLEKLQKDPMKMRIKINTVYVTVLCVLRDRGMTSNIVAQRLANVRQTNVSSRTVRRRLKSFGLTSRKPVTAPLLLPHHRRARLNFAMEHTYWTEEQWGSVLFTDESRFTLRSPDGREVKGNAMRLVAFLHEHLLEAEVLWSRGEFL